MNKVIVLFLKGLLIIDFIIELYNGFAFDFLLYGILNAISSLIILYLITKQQFTYFYTLSLILTIMLFINKFYYYKPIHSYSFIYYLLLLVIIILIYLSIVNELKFVNPKMKNLIFPILLFFSLLTYLLIYEHNEKVLLKDYINKNAIIIKKSYKYFTYEYSINNKKYKKVLPFFNNFYPNSIQIGDTIKIKVSKEDNSVSRILEELK